MRIDLIQDGLESYWPVTAFTKAYGNKNALTGCAIATISAEIGNPEKTALIVLRSFIEDSRVANNEGQKYVLGLKFYNFGNLATIDVISLDKKFHKEIACEHLKKMNWPLFNEEMGRTVDYFDETTRAPFIFVGGYLEIRDGVVEFKGSSGDYGNTIFFSNSNSICEYIASASGLKTKHTELEEVFIKKILEFMLEHKGSKDFYERFLQETLNNAPEIAQSFTTQQLGAFLVMKSLDRAINENTNIIQIIVDEMVEGFGRYATVASVAEHVKRKRSRK